VGAYGTRGTIGSNRPGKLGGVSKGIMKEELVVCFGGGENGKPEREQSFKGILGGEKEKGVLTQL